VVDQISGEGRTVQAKAVINATGIFTDRLRRMDDPGAQSIMAQSRGTHIVLDHRFLPGEAAILVPKTSDGRVVFIIPWEGRTLVGTTDIPVDGPEMEPTATEEEIEFLLRYAARYLSTPPRRQDVLAAFAGLRPLVKGNAGSTAALSRDHTLLVSDSGMVTITGGKWTTYRRMAQDAVTRAAHVGGLAERPCVTERLKLVGSGSTDARWRELGATAQVIFEYEAKHSGMLHPRLPYSFAMVAYVVEHEMPVHLDDVLSRRLRALLLDAAASVEAAPDVAALMAQLQGRDATWIAQELERYRALASTYGAVQAAEAPVGSGHAAPGA
jgi:glycerol-3-phosphate dehydrogenase